MNAYPLGRWTLRVNPFKSGAKPVAPGVQGELSLDKVKVVRNDLTDSDLELVAAVQAAKAEGNVFGGTATGKLSWWARMKKRFGRQKPA